MSTQIAIRLTEEMVAFLDRAVAAGKVSSRTALVSSALEREMRRLLAEEDVAVLTQVGTADGLDSLVDCPSATSTSATRVREIARPA